MSKLDKSLTVNNDVPILQFIYENYRGIKSTRSVQNPLMWFGETKYHKGQQWFIHGYCLEKEKFRDFAVVDILTFLDNKGE